MVCSRFLILFEKCKFFTGRCIMCSRCSDVDKTWSVGCGRYFKCMYSIELNGYRAALLGNSSLNLR